MEDEGCLSVLNCCEGDIKISFDKADPQEVARASRIIKDMLKRGYFLFVEIDGEVKKVAKFDEEYEEYILADGPEDPAVTVPNPNLPKVKGKPGRKKGIPMRRTKATGVGRTAGG